MHFSDRYKLPEQVEHNLVNGYYVPHTYDGEKASGKTVYVSQFPLYFESQGVVDNYARCHALDEDREKIISEFGEAADKKFTRKKTRPALFVQVFFNVI